MLLYSACSLNLVLGLQDKAIIDADFWVLPSQLHKKLFPSRWQAIFHHLRAHAKRWVPLFVPAPFGVSLNPTPPETP